MTLDKWNLKAIRRTNPITKIKYLKSFKKMKKYDWGTNTI